MTTTQCTSSQSTSEAFVAVNEAENERRARRLISHAVQTARTHRRVIGTDTARLIAATIHRGPTTALGRFAATGDLDQVNRRGADIELWRNSANELRPSWWNALDRYLKQEPHHGTA